MTGIPTPFHARAPKERLDAMRNAAPLGGIGGAQDCVGGFLFLASDELSGYVSGKLVHVDGGMFMP